jgi:hypothetical protein
VTATGRGFCPSGSPGFEPDPNALLRGVNENRCTPHDPTNSLPKGTIYGLCALQAGLRSPRVEVHLADGRRIHEEPTTDAGTAVIANRTRYPLVSKQEHDPNSNCPSDKPNYGYRYTSRDRTHPPSNLSQSHSAHRKESDQNGNPEIQVHGSVLEEEHWNKCKAHHDEDDKLCQVQSPLQERSASFIVGRHEDSSSRAPHQDHSPVARFARRRDVGVLEQELIDGLRSMICRRRRQRSP